jgi:hypothetical protein
MKENYWLDESQRVLVRVMDDSWEDYDEYKAIVDDYKAKICTAGYPVVMLVDCRELHRIPKDALRQCYEANQELPNNLLGFVVLTEMRWVELFSSLTQRFLPRPKTVVFARTMDKAYRKCELMLEPPKKRRVRAKKAALEP